jgi:CHAT domain-containing protein/Tfp pilus assembly protein PilF
MSHCRASCSKPKIQTGRSFRWLAVAGIHCTILSSTLHLSTFTQKLVRETRAEAPEQTNAGQEVITLELGKLIERELSGGQKHDYEIALTKGQFISVGIKLRGIDARVMLQPPDGDPVEVFNIGETLQKASFYRVAQSSGIYRLTVHARAKAPAGRYEIHLAELRMSTEEDRALQEARELITESIRLNREGKYGDARPLLIRALEIREKVSGPDSPGMVQALNMLAGNLEETGDYASAEPLRVRALKIVEKLRGPEHPEVARQLIALGSLYQKKGDDLKAEEAHQRALGIFEKAQLEETHIVASLLGALGSIYYGRGDYGDAERYYQRSRAVWEKLLGPDHFHLEPTFIFLGRVAYDAGDYAKAKAMFERALTLREKALAHEESGIPRRLNDLAMLYVTTREYANAESLYRRALSIYEKGGMSDPNVQETLYGLARLYGAQGDAAAAVRFQSQATDIEARHVELNLAVGSEREKKAFLANFSLRASRNVSLHTNLAPDDGAARNLAVTTLLQRKGRVQDALSESLAGLRRRANAEDQALFDELNRATSQLARLILDGPQQNTPVEHQNEVKTLEEKREGLEGEVSRRSAGFYEKAEPVTLAAVQPAIPKEAALVEFAVYRPYDPKAPDNQKAYGDPRYVAYVVRRQGDVQWAELGDAKKIEDAISAWRQAVRTPTGTEVRSLSRVLDEKVMRPVRTLVGDATQLLVSPDGELNLVPFAALIDEGGRYLVERYAINYLTSGRDLLRLQTRRDSKSAPVVIADPAFGAPAVIASAEGTRRGKGADGRARLDYSQVFFGPLPGIADEVRALKTLLPQATFLTREQATEATLKRVSGPSILHIATHGFFLENDSSANNAANAKTPDATRLGKWVARVDNPLLRSGLALAGANQGRSGDDDGVLTALEATALDLWGTKLVVLSACDTGVGEVKNGDGVYGLRRALFLAGTESQLMSLWPVSDRSTRDLMAGYYQALVQNAGRGEALRQVQLKMLRNKSRSHPYYWASFIVAGEWANLKGQR